jgi:hypothetical protein
MVNGGESMKKVWSRLFLFCLIIILMSANMFTASAEQKPTAESVGLHFVSSKLGKVQI